MKSKDDVSLALIIWAQLCDLDVTHIFGRPLLDLDSARDIAFTARTRIYNTWDRWTSLCAPDQRRLEKEYCYMFL